MAIQLSRDDTDALVRILSQHAEWQLPRGRSDLLSDVFAGSPRRGDILGQLDIDGAPRWAAVRVVQRLTQFGQDEPGSESIAVLINKLISYLGGGEDAETLRRIMDAIPVSTPAVAAQPIRGWQGHDSGASVAERIIGENTLRDICFLELLLTLAAGVCRIRTQSGIGTGFLIGEDLVLTNHHVIGSASEASGARFEFNYQLDAGGAEKQVHATTARDGGTFVTSPNAPRNAGPDELDYTVVQISDPPGGVMPLRLRRAAPRRDERVTIVQHPGGSYKKVSLQNNYVEYVDDLVVQYTTSTEPGSSGAPVLADDLTVVAVHHAGGSLTEPRSQRRYMRNEGIRVAAILGSLARHPVEALARLGN